jgi:asparagine synthase (glutamine-hydrolysing)
MCGISGLMGPTRIDLVSLQRMTDLIRHRGPDDEGYAVFGPEGIACLSGADTDPAALHTAVPYRPTGPLGACSVATPKVALGHRRLSIVDLSPLGHQPMCDRHGRYWVAYNGEVYNHVELRAELESAGHTFNSHSDTEVILAAYAQWGADCLTHFNGMWALALYDARERTLLLARDRFGVKPLYYWIGPDGTLAFASEIKQFTVLEGWQAALNGQRAYDFLVHGLSDHGDETMFRGVYQLRPGHRAMLREDTFRSMRPGGRIESKRWYGLPTNRYEGSFADAVQGFRERFVDAVRLRLRADVPVGSCLSGGLDSSSIVGTIHQLLQSTGGAAQCQQRTYSACSTVSRFDERKWIDEVVRHTGVDAHFVYPSIDGLLSDGPAITWHQDEPFGSTSIYAQWQVFKLAADDGMRVMLDGQGADEQLAGYHMFFGARLGALAIRLRWLELMREAVAIRRLHGYGVTALSRYLAPHLLPAAVFDWGKRLTGHSHQAPGWLNMGMLNALPVNPFHASGAFDASVQSMSVSQLTASNLQMLLHWEDRNSMAHSIESRVPFLDYRLVEFVVGLPDEFKLFRGVTKRVLRESMHSTIPASVVGRMDKLGFVTPEEVWVREQAPQAFRQQVANTLESARGIFDADALRAEVDAIIAGTKKFSFLPWRVANFGHWCQAFSVKC